MSVIDIAAANESLQGLSPLEIVRWAIEQAPGRTIVSSNFRPYEAVLLHLCTRVQPDIPVLWVDHGCNRPATYRHMANLTERLGLNIKAYVPRQTAAHREALEGPLPEPDDEAGLKRFSATFKLEPFKRGMQELAPTIWLTALRRVQNPNREGMELVSADETFRTIKVSPVLDLTDADMDAYLARYELPNEWDYWDPAKADEKRECGLHVDWGAQAVKSS
ncbi:MAG: phosphoadenylylsulfate reductase [Myxococcales bacterium FL481]|nr:MAG: phosphoadenylylsulfate reductase [Myxococcales bacterium FL481]